MPDNSGQSLLKAYHQAPHRRNVGAARFIKLLALGVCLLVVICGSAESYRIFYFGRIYPGVSVAGYPLGGMTAREAKNFFENVNNRYAKEGIDLDVLDAEGKSHRLKLNTVIAGDSTTELIRIDSDAAVRSAMSLGRTRSWILNEWYPLVFRFSSGGHFAAPLSVNDRVLAEVLKDTVGQFEDAPHNANVAFSENSLANYTIIPEKAGLQFNLTDAVKKVKGELALLSFAPVKITPVSFKPTITAKDVQKLLPRLPELFAYGDIALNFVDSQTNIRRDWVLAPATFAHWLKVRADVDGNFIFSWDLDQTQKYLQDQAQGYIDIDARDAKFVVENGKVKEFQASMSGRRLNVVKTARDLISAFEERNYHPANAVKTVSASVDIIAPNIKTADVNNLGITDILGIGVSTFKDSHTNRIKNIAHAAALLNGVLVKPGEKFSALKFAGPFSAQNGFLPEMVIKGREIRPEIGGGMCQIGTTLFRMAMNSGMPIEERHNHSLVVSYYADPVNHNPGTDATLYEPLLDFKFQNDTGNYLLVQTDIDFKRQQLTFTLWGKPDERKGWYSHPVVSKWIPAGEPQEITIDDPVLVKPGERKCQTAFRGAVASFTYTRITSTTQKIDRVFESYYRPLPKICMTGATSTLSVPGVETSEGIIDSIQ